VVTNRDPEVDWPVGLPVADPVHADQLLAAARRLASRPATSPSQPLSFGDDRDQPQPRLGVHAEAGTAGRVRACRGAVWPAYALDKARSSAQQCWTLPTRPASMLRRESRANEHRQLPRRPRQPCHRGFRRRLCRSTRHRRTHPPRHQPYSPGRPPRRHARPSPGTRWGCKVLPTALCRSRTASASSTSVAVHEIQERRAFSNARTACAKDRTSTASDLPRAAGRATPNSRSASIASPDAQQLLEGGPGREPRHRGPRRSNQDQSQAVYRPSEVRLGPDAMGHNEKEPAGQSRCGR
jgi:hypothetical protein